MRENIGRGMFFSGFALIVATAIRAIADMLQTKPVDPWSAVLAAGCILMSIGWGLVKRR